MRQVPNYGPVAVLLYAFALFVVLAVFITALGMWFKWDRPLLAGVVLGGGAGVAVAVWLVIGYNRFLWKVEKMSKGRLELTGDNHTGRPPAEPKVQEVVRPFPVWQPSHSARPQAAAPLAPSPELAREREPIFKAPSGRNVTWKELEEFAARVPIRGTSFTGYWREAYELAGYEDPHGHWQDVVDLWHIFGCCDERKERHTVKWKARTHEEAMRALGTANANRPTP